MNLEKIKMPLFFYQTHKQPQDGANELDNSNSKDNDLEKVNGKLEEMEIIQVVPLKMLKAHHYTEDELKKMNDNGESREIYEYLFMVLE
ncbi:uncharacterized protein TA03260 [Theileria annulata]|uniref:Uncharacterized protein n=1 Tax=Theileria annulata TaxID=5874 RepID=Q4UCP0_THEAN|nr:uncharacterized protein TA03260 [Theileria annulata]CAI75411.1 hypothetical protein TA03260 [Theileria annulata]|eukprot:XP_954887.1 hypothetical protein TA03260 [Theileria annulata]